MILDVYDLLAPNMKKARSLNEARKMCSILVDANLKELNEKEMVDLFVEESDGSDSDIMITYGNMNELPDRDQEFEDDFEDYVKVPFL